MTNQFLWGSLTVASAIAGLFFLRFWRTTADRLFAFFALSFWLFSLSWLGLALINPADETRHYMYLVRLVGFLILLVGVVDKNRGGRSLK